MGGHQVPERGPIDDGYDGDGYDESQRAEILEATRDGPGDGTILTDLAPDLGGEPLEDDDPDAIEMLADETAEEDEDVAQDEADIVEDDLQQDFEDGADDADAALGDGDAVALRP
ncbi:DNA primase [Sphingomonas sp.]|uniref:DNA primase n=1 Tax=Sphingomonas sp. TaxID=28214 RepID=UPI002DD68E53|nr:DNA primase [Sphingomonas sp.]